MSVIADISEGDLFEEAKSENKSTIEKLMRTAKKINEAYKKVSDNIKRFANEVLEGVTEPIPNFINKWTDAKLRTELKQAGSKDQIFIVREMANRMRVNPLKLLAVLMAIGTIVIPLGVLTGIGISEGSKKRNVRGGLIDRHRNAMKQFNIKNSTSLHAKDANQL